MARSPLHRVRAWATASPLVLGQTAVEPKIHEITAIPTLLQLLALSGCIVTIDAMGTQTEIAKTSVAQEAAYVLALKGHQGTLHEDGALCFEWADPEPDRDLLLWYAQPEDRRRITRQLNTGEARHDLRAFLMVANKGQALAEEP